MVAIQIISDLTPRQFSKFKSLFAKKRLERGKVYFLTNEMHGVLLTNSRQGAMNIVKAHLRHVQIYIENFNDEQYIKHIGIDVLLEALGDENPKKKTQYLAARAYIASQLANDPEVFKDAQITGNIQDREKIQAMNDTKKQATHCALSGIAFGKGIQCCVHHIEGVSEQPALAADPANLIPLTKAVHDDYHSWVISKKQSITKASLKQFALERDYSRNW